MNERRFSLDELPACGSARSESRDRTPEIGIADGWWDAGTTRIYEAWSLTVGRGRASEATV